MGPLHGPHVDMPQPGSISFARSRVALASWVETPLTATKAVGNGACVACAHQSQPSKDGGDGHDKQAWKVRVQLVEKTGL